jgi:alkylated DNA repair dioxygenase AlkB
LSIIASVVIRKNAFKNNPSNFTMDLFSTDVSSNENLLPKDGSLYYHGKIFPKEKADHYLNYLMETIPWKNDEIIIYGKKLLTKRKVAWYGDRGTDYTYSHITKQALTWTSELLELKTAIEQITQHRFNSCLLNLYQNGEESMGWHSDAEKELKKDGVIASLSFGAERKFVFKHKETKEKRELQLEHGSLLLMGGTIQSHWLHSLPPMKRVTKPRVNLSFRTIVI